MRRRRPLLGSRRLRWFRWWAAAPATAALAALALLSPPSVAPANAAAVTISVDATSILNNGTSAGGKLGINLDYWWDHDANRPAGSASLASALSGMKMKFWRYPGGEKSDGYLWSTPPYTAPNPRLARVSATDWPSNDSAYWTPAGSPSGTWSHPVLGFDQFMTACRAAGCIPDIVVAYDGAHKPAAPGGTSPSLTQAVEMAKGWVRYANVTKAYGIKYWEVGNETWLPGYMGGDPGRLTQAQDFVTMATAMKSVDPTIKVCTSAHSKADFDILLATARRSIDCLITHSYPAYGLAGYAAYVNTPALKVAEVDAAWAALLAYPEDRGRIQIIESEYGGATYGVGGSWTQNDLGHALMTAEMTGRLLQDRRVAFSEYWTTRWLPQVTPDVAGELDALNARNGLTAQGHALNIFGNHTLSSMVAAAPQSGTLITFASRGSGTNRLNVFLINKSTTAVTGNVALRNYTATASTAVVRALTGASYATTTPTWGLRPSVPVQGASLTVALPPTSLTVVSLS